MPTLRYVFVINNYTDGHIAKLNSHDNWRYLKYAKEVGKPKEVLDADETLGPHIIPGTPHLQGYIELFKPQKLKPFFKNEGGWWFQPAKGTAEENINYIQKQQYREDGTVDETNIYTRGVPAEPKKGCRNDLEELKKAIDSGATYDEICDQFFDDAAKYHKFIKERIVARDEQLVLSKHRTTFSDFVLRPWQESVANHLEGPVHPRQINWVWEQVGNTGKSTMASYLEVQKGALVLEPAGKKDLAYIISQTIGLKEIVVFDLARCQEPDANEKYNPLAGFYNICEGLKNGCITNTKYESKRFRVNVPHVWVFANFPPDATKWSKDRYMVYTIKNNELEEAMHGTQFNASGDEELYPLFR